MRFKKWLVAAALGTAALSAWAASGQGSGLGAGPMGEAGPGHAMFGMGPEGGPGGHRHSDHRGHGEGRAMDPERANARIDRMTDRLIKSVDGTPEQREKISGIARTAAADLMTLRKQSGDLRRQALDLLKAPTVDRVAMETLRSQQMSVADALSKRMTTALADTAEVLTPEQRAKFASRWERRRG